MAQWYAQLVFKGDAFLGEGLSDLALIEGFPSEDASTVPNANGDERYTAVIVSGYALYGELRGYYALGVAHIAVDPETERAHYVSEKSAMHQEPVESLSAGQRAALRNWLIDFSRTAWENSTDSFRSSLRPPIPNHAQVLSNRGKYL